MSEGIEVPFGPCGSDGRGCLLATATPRPDGRSCRFLIARSLLIKQEVRGS
jgi:hypothetical protein